MWHFIKITPIGLTVTSEKHVLELVLPLDTPLHILHTPLSPVQQMLVLEVSLIRPVFSVWGVDRGAASLMYGTRCPLPDVVQADMQVWHEASFQGWP